MKHVLVFFLALVAAGPALSIEITREDWLARQSTAIPTALCMQSQRFRECYSVTKAECTEVVKAATQTCLLKFEPRLPEVLDTRGHIRFWGGALAACAGTSYESTMADRRKSGNWCDDQTGWE
ncbi:MAG: hypothetical protein HKN19_01005 [Halioglobus sp.]|nr:hypothetical protein [Halioglobus sp.]